jgi:uncharacterized protein (TIGR02118 family)
VINAQAEGTEPNTIATRRAMLRGIGLGGVAVALMAAGWRVETVAQDGAAEPNAVVILYGEPTEKAKFVGYYNNSHIPLALTLPALQSTDYGPLLGLPGGEAGADFWFAVLRYADADDLQASLASDAGKAVLADVKYFATGGVTIYLAHLETAIPGGASATPVG